MKFSDLHGQVCGEQPPFKFRINRKEELVKGFKCRDYCIAITIQKSTYGEAENLGKSNSQHCIACQIVNQPASVLRETRLTEATVNRAAEM